MRDARPRARSGRSAPAHPPEPPFRSPPDALRVNGIAVGSTATSALETVLEMPEVRDAMIAATPLRFIGDPTDIALGVLYLASPAARYVTGKIIEIDGGTQASTLELPFPDL